jgi:AcrR family transcriptional regulator
MTTGRHEEILSAALEVFAERGYKGTLSRSGRA